MTTDRAEQRRQNAIKTLQQMNERVLQSRVIEPYFKRINWVPYNVHGLREGTHGCDLILTSPLHYGDVLRGVQLKNKLNIGDGGDVDKNILTDATTAIQYEHPPFYKRFDRFFWITTGEISQSGWIGIKERIDNNSVLFGRRVVVWDVNRLVKEIDEAGCGDLLDDLDLNRLEREVEKHERNEEGIFAAYYWHRIGRWHLTHQNHDPQAAKEAFDRATQLLKRDSRKSIYYHRTLIRYSEMWSQLACRWHEIDFPADDPLVDIVRSPRAEGILAEKFPESVLPLLQDTELVFQQLEILQERQFVKYASLEMLQITRLLLRMGYPSSLPGMEERFEQIANELSEEDGRSIDRECSLCTSYAVSCYALANRGVEIEPALQWLGSLEAYRYVHLRWAPRNPGEHSLHYAAMVLLAFLDNRADAVEDVVSVFFRSQETDSHGFYREWMRYRNEDRYWVSRHIFTAFLLFILSGRSLSEERTDALRRALKAMIKSLKEEAEEVEARYFYPIRENLGTFSLGLILEVDESDRMARKVVRILRERGAETVKSQKKDRQELWDSSLDRTPVLIEGLLQYWETILYLEEQGYDIKDLMADSEGQLDERTYYD